MGQTQTRAEYITQYHDEGINHSHPWNKNDPIGERGGKLKAKRARYHVFKAPSNQTHPGTEGSTLQSLGAMQRYYAFSCQNADKNQKQIRPMPIHRNAYPNRPYQWNMKISSRAISPSCRSPSFHLSLAVHVYTESNSAHPSPLKRDFWIITSAGIPPRWKANNSSDRTESNKHTSLQAGPKKKKKKRKRQGK